MFKKTTAIRANVLRKTANNIRSIKYNTGMSTGEIIDHLMLKMCIRDSFGTGSNPVSAHNSFPTSITLNPSASVSPAHTSHYPYDTP